MTLILASGSPRRSELLKQIGVRFEVVVKSIDETPAADETAHRYVQRMALEKARQVAPDFRQRTVLAADTCIGFEQQILTKPIDANDAQAMLRKLSGQVHQVYSAVALSCGEREEVVTVCSDVHFKPLTDQQIADYVATQEPLDKAGSYAIQGLGAVFIEKINGSYSSVVGLPLAETAVLLQQFNIPMWQR